MTKAIQTRPIEPDIYQQISVLFTRLLLRDSTERARFLIEPAQGVEVAVCVFLGDPPKELREHYQRHALAKSSKPPESGTTWKIAVAPSASAALEILRDDLMHALHLRIVSDRAAWEMAGLGSPDEKDALGKLWRAKAGQDEDTDPMGKLRRIAKGESA